MVLGQDTGWKKVILRLTSTNFTSWTACQYEKEKQEITKSPGKHLILFYLVLICSYLYCLQLWWVFLCESLVAIKNDTLKDIINHYLLVPGWVTATVRVALVIDRSDTARSLTLGNNAACTSMRLSTLCLRLVRLRLTFSHLQC